jgi:hypothetical protein
VLWSTAALLAVVGVWVLRVADLAPTVVSHGRLLDLAAFGVPVLAAASGLGAIVLISPHAGIPAARRLSAAAGVALYVPLCVLLWMLHAGLDRRVPPGYFEDIPADSGRAILRIGVALLLANVIMFLRPNARMLASRSLLMRSGRVDRQTMLALAAVLMVGVIGDALHLFSAFLPRDDTRQLLKASGDLVILVGAILFTLGVVNAMVDCWRLRGVLAEKPLTLSGLLSVPGAEATSPRGSPEDRP